MPRRALLIAGGAIVLILVAWPDAQADYLGSDPFRDLTGGEANGLMGRYPLSAYGLDTHIDSGLLPGASWGEEAAAWVAGALWWLTVAAVKLTISFVGLAFSLDLLDEDGALAPIAQATRRLHETLSEPGMGLAVVVLALWGVKRAIFDRRHTEAIGGLLRSAAFMILALILILRPMDTVGQVASMTNTAAQGILVGVNGGSLQDPERAKTRIMDELWRAHGLNPWVVLNFGALRHCVDTDRRNDDGYPKSVAPDDARRDVCRDHVRQVDGWGGYAPRFLAQAPGSDERNAEFQALADGRVPVDPPRRGAPDTDRGDQFAGYNVDKSDSPAVDIQQKGGGYNRLGLSVAIAVATVPFVILYGVIAIAVILVQIAALLLLAFAGPLLFAAAFPGRGHRLFESWALTLLGLLALKMVLAVVIVVMVTVTISLMAATGTQGWAYVFGLLAALYTLVIVKRNHLQQMAAARSATRVTERTIRSSTERTIAIGAAAVAAPYAATKAVLHGRQESAHGGGGQEGAHEGADAPEPTKRDDYPAEHTSGSREHQETPAADSVHSPPATVQRSVHSSPEPEPPASREPANSDELEQPVLSTTHGVQAPEEGKVSDLETSPERPPGAGPPYESIERLRQPPQERAPVGEPHQPPPEYREEP